MFPKNTVPTAAMPPEKPPVPEKEGVVLCMVEDKDIQVDIDQNKGTIRQTTICACAVVLTTLILVAGTLGAITIVLTHSSRFASDAEPHHTPQLDGNSPTDELPETPPRVKIDDGGLWPPQTTTSDLVVVEGAPDDTIKFGDGGGNGNVDNEVEIINDGVTPPRSEPTPNYEHSIIFSSSSSQSGDPHSSEYNRNYMSSSFPPWEEKNQDSQVTGPEDSSPQTTTSDLVVVEGAPDDDIKFGDSGGPGNVDEVEIINDGVTPPKSEPTPNHEYSIIFSSSSSELEDPSSSDYVWGRTYLSSSFPYGGYYMRDAVDITPWEGGSQYSPVTGSGDSSGDSQVVGGVDVDQEADESGSGEQSPQYIDTASFISVQSSSYDDDNTLSDMYYDSTYR